MAEIVRVAVENAAYHFDKLYDYLVPAGMTLAPGQRVVVPFGRGKARCRMGLVLELAEAPAEAPGPGIKAVQSAADPEPVLDEELLRLLRWLKAETFCTWYDGLRVLLPGGYGMRTQRSWSPRRGEGYDEASLSPQAAQLLRYLLGRKKPVGQEELLEAMGLAENHPALRELEERGLAQCQDLLKRRVQDQKIQMVRLAPDWEAALLTPKQEQVLELLQGVDRKSTRLNSSH